MPTTDSSHKLQTFEKGEAIEVAVEEIESELRTLWQRAAEKRPGPEAVTRACLWNLLVRVEGEERFSATKQLIDEVSAHISARAIVVRAEGASVGPGQIRAWVEANWRRGEGNRTTGSDEVTLLVSGDALSRLPALLRSLLSSDAPSAMLWYGPPPSATAPIRELLHEMDRLIVDTRKLPDESGLAELARLVEREPQLDLADLSWLGISPLRGLCASLFDPPRDPHRLTELTRVRVVSGVGGTQARALLALGWLAASLGWRALVPAVPGPSVRRWQAQTPSGASLTIELETRLGGARHGVVALELEAAPGGPAGHWALARDQHCIEVKGPGLPTRMQPARSHTDAELVVSALGGRGRDPAYREALLQAAELVSVRG